MTDLTTSIIGINDAPGYVWFLWHTQSALRTGNFGNILHTTLQAFPIGIPLRFDTPFLNSLLSYPAFLIGGPVVAYNTLLILTFILTCIGMYLFLREFVHDRAAALIGSLGFTFSSYRLMRMMQGQADLLSTEWIGFFLFFWYRYQKNSQQKFLLFGLIISYILQAYSDYRTFFMLTMVAGIIMLVNLFRSWKNHALGHIMRTILIFSLGSLIGLLPLLYIHRSLLLLSYRPDTTEYAYIALHRSLELQDYLYPYGGFTLYSSNGFYTYIGAVSLLLIALYLLFRRKTAGETRTIFLWLGIGIFFTLLSFGTRIVWEGRELLKSPWLPYNLLIDTPIFRLFHDPRRFSMVVHLSVSVLVAISWKSIFSRIKKPVFLIPTTLVGIACIILQYTLFLPFLTTPLSHSPITQAIGSGPAGSVLTFPFGYFDAFYMNKKERKYGTALFAQILYRKPLLAADVSYVDDETAARFRNDPVLTRLDRCQRYYLCEPLTSDEIHTLKNNYQLKYIWVTDTGSYAHLVPFIRQSFPNAAIISESNQLLYELP